MSVTDVMQEPIRQTDARAPERTRWSWAWLGLGAALLPFTVFQTIVPIAAWLAPIFLLRFARDQRARVALPILALVGYGALLVGLRGFFGAPDVFMWALGGLVIAVPYGADKLAAGRLHGLARTLVLPAVDTGLAVLVGLDQGSPLGSWGATGYTQVANLPLLQATSVLGVYGLSFVIMWAAPVVNELWERRFDVRAARLVVVPFGVVVLAALLFGGIRLAMTASPAQVAQMAALAPDRDLDAARAAANIEARPRTAADRERLAGQHLAPVLDDLFVRTRRAARAGAKVVAWSEAAGIAFKEDEQAVLDQAAGVARDEGIYLELGMAFILPATEHPTAENRSILIDPAGEVVWDYDKATVVPGDGNALGSGELPVVDTPYGRLSVAICFDADFPWLVRQAGRADVDVLLVPSSDWGPVGPMHADMAVVRAVENGVSILRPTRKGTSLAIDPYGRTLASADYFASRETRAGAFGPRDVASRDDQTMLAAVPIEGATTVYPVLGDAVGWASLAGVIVAAGVVGVRRRRRSRP
jgi:apolipoprotein N-acyltransferase